jgi:hypothetical protein
MSIQWSADTRNRLHGFRTSDTNDPKDACLDASVAWAYLRAVDGGCESDAKEEPAFGRLMKQFGEEAPPAFDQELELRRAACVLGLLPERHWRTWEGWAPERALVSLWVIQGGVEATLGVLLQAGDFWAETSATESGGVRDASVKLVSAPDPDLKPVAYSLRPNLSGMGGALHVVSRGCWSALRCHLGAQSDSDFAAANKVAHALRKKLAEGDHWGRAAIAFAFSRDPSHALGEIGRKNTVAPELLLVAAPSADAAASIVKACLAGDGCLISDVAFDLVESFGEGAGPILSDALALQKKAKIPASERKWNTAPLEQALTLIREVR